MLQFAVPCMPRLLNFTFGFPSGVSWEVWWDAGTGLRLAITLSCLRSAAGALSPSSPPALLSLLLGGTGKAAGEHREHIWTDNVHASVQPFIVPRWGLQRLQMCRPKAN